MHCLKNVDDAVVGIPETTNFILLQRTARSFEVDRKKPPTNALVCECRNNRARNGALIMAHVEETEGTIISMREHKFLASTLKSNVHVSLLVCAL